MVRDSDWVFFIVQKEFLIKSILIISFNYFGPFNHFKTSIYKHYEPH